jgi:exosortase A-associated hydrolase 2
MNDSSLHNIEPFFMPSPNGNLFSIYTSPTENKVVGGVLYIPPFAEEMNKSRRMAALQSREFARMGYGVLQIDLPGCGDSSGDFAEASWESWMQAAITAYEWLRNKIQGPLYLWGLRLGATLAAELSTQLPKLSGLILWQPIINGALYLNQILRIKLVQTMLSEGKFQSGTRELHHLLSQGESIEVGGYLLSSVLAMQIERLQLSEMLIPISVVWLEINSSIISPLSPAVDKVVQAWCANGTPLRIETLPGETFWNTQEISENHTLLEITSQLFSSR